MYKKRSSSWMKHLDFIIQDVFCIQIALFVAYIFRNGLRNPFSETIYQQMMVIVAITDIVIVFFAQSYKGILRRGYFKEFKETIYHVSLTITGFILFSFITKTGEQYSRMIVILMWEISIILCYITRIYRKRIIKQRALASGKGRKSMIVIIDRESAVKFVSRICRNNFDDRKLNGIIVLDEDMTGANICDIPVVASKQTAVAYMCQNWVDEVITAYHDNQEELSPILEDCREMGITVHTAIMECGLDSGKKKIENVCGYTAVTSYLSSSSNRQIFAKRIMDICGGIVGCLITLVLCIFVAPAIFICSPGPIFFAQTRVGKNGKLFKIYKFRSMYMDAEERKKELMESNKIKSGMMFKMDNDPRIIKGIGHFIRKTSIDEFPQFFNVLKGDMSLVGTRPPTIDEWEKYNKHHRRRMAIKPGLTGMWQVSGRSEITDFDEVVALDTKYITEWNIGLDIKILFKTVAILFTGKGSQ